MAITTAEFEKGLEEYLDKIASRKRCGWCGGGEKETRPRSSLCQACKSWRRREHQALARQIGASTADPYAALYAQYEVEFARLCREEGHIRSWEGPVSTLDLERELEGLTGHLFGEKDALRGTIGYFAQFSPAQRRLLMYILQRMTKTWLRHHRRDFAIHAAHETLFPRRPSRSHPDSTLHC